MAGWEGARAGCGPRAGRGKGVATHGSTRKAARCTEMDGSTRPRASRKLGAHTCTHGQCGAAG
eukprot:2612722-Pleurochrysis_carterae.AAC.2